MFLRSRTLVKDSFIHLMSSRNTRYHIFNVIIENHVFFHNLDVFWGVQLYESWTFFILFE